MRTWRVAIVGYGWAAGAHVTALARIPNVEVVAICTSRDVERAGVDKEVLAAYDASVETLAKLGARIEHVKLPHRFSDYAAATGRIIGAEGYRFVGHLVDDERQPVDPHVRPRIQIGRGVSARDYLLALAEREERSREVADALAHVDALLTPTALTPPIPIDQADQAGTAAHFTRPVNYLGLCGLAVPNGFTVGGLPISLQIVAHAGHETRVRAHRRQHTVHHGSAVPGVRDELLITQVRDAQFVA